MNNDDLLRTIETNFALMTELVNSQNSAVRAKIEESHHFLDVRLTGIIERQDVSNGKLQKHEEKIDCLNNVTVPELKTRIKKAAAIPGWIIKHPFISALIFFLAITASNYVANNYTIKDILEIVKIVK